MSGRGRAAGPDDGVTAPRQIGSPPLDAERLYHELQVHQIELEQQNEELRAARAEIETLLRRYTDLYDFAPVAYLTLKRDGTIDEANLTAAGMLGVPRSELHGRRLRSFLAGDTARDLDRFLAGLAVDTSPDGCDLRIRTADGSDVIVHIDGSAESAGVAYRVVLIDVTARREAEARLDRAERVEMVGRLAAGVAHDFNNLLAAINGYAEFLADEIPADDPMHGDVEAIREAGSRAADLTRQLLAFGRRQTLHPTVVDVDEVLGHLGPILRSLLGAGVDLVTAHAGPPARTRVDRTSIEQAITNLVLNARDAMPGAVG